MKRYLMCLLAAGVANVAAAPVEQTVDYEIDGTRFQSVLVYDDAAQAKRPGLLMFPNWLGINADALARARELAGSEYVILVADMYGADVRPANFEDAGKASGVVTADRELMRTRAQRALAELTDAADGIVDADRLVAFGFCFGGTTAIELARTGAAIKGAVSFHGNPAPAPGFESGRIDGEMLVLHGADDSFVPQDDLRAVHCQAAAFADCLLVDGFQ